MDASNVKVIIETKTSAPDLKIISIKGSIDAVTLKHVDEKVLPVIEKEESNIILDLTNLAYLSSTGMMCLIKYLVLLTDKRKSFKLVKPPQNVYDTLRVAGIAKHFDIYDTVDEAVQALQ